MPHVNKVVVNGFKDPFYDIIKFCKFQVALIYYFFSMSL